MTPLEYLSQYYHYELLVGSTQYEIRPKRVMYLNLSHHGKDKDVSRAISAKDRLIGLLAEELRENPTRLRNAVREVDDKTRDKTRDKTGTVMMHVHSGKGTHADVSLALKLVAYFQDRLGPAYWTAGEKTETNIERWAERFIGLDCSGYVGAYAKTVGSPGKEPNTPIAAYVNPPSVRRRSIDQIQAGDIVAFKNLAHIRLINQVLSRSKNTAMVQLCESTTGGLRDSQMQITHKGGDVFGADVDVYVCELANSSGVQAPLSVARMNDQENSGVFGLGGIGEVGSTVGYFGPPAAGGYGDATESEGDVGPVEWETCASVPGADADADANRMAEEDSESTLAGDVYVDVMGGDGYANAAAGGSYAQAVEMDDYANAGESDCYEIVTSGDENVSSPNDVGSWSSSGDYAEVPNVSAGESVDVLASGYTENDEGASLSADYA